MKWTGWPGSEIKRTPIGELVHAIKARIAFLEATMIGEKKGGPISKPPPKNRAEIEERAKATASSLIKKMRGR